MGKGNKEKDVELKEITGWKWSTISEYNTAEAKALIDVNPPKGSTEKTRSCLLPLISYTDRGVIDFYYIGDNDTSQMKSTLGRASDFNIRFLDSPKES